MFRIRKSLPKLARFASAAGLALVAAACSTDVVSPVAPRTLSIEAAAGKSSGGGGGGGGGVASADTLVVTFTINPQSNTSVSIGEHKLTIPANSVCDPMRSTYGPKEWDKSCTLLTSPLSMVAKSWTNEFGNPQVDFSRDLRFVPGRNGELPVISLKVKTAADLTIGRIFYCASPKSTCIDESLTDPILTTQTDAANGFLYRIIKHFSGYNVWA